MFETDYDEINYNGHPIKVTPQGQLAAVDLAKALGYSKQQFYMLTSKHPDLLRKHVDTFRFDRRGPPAQVLDYAGVRTYLDHVASRNPEAVRLASKIDAEIQERRARRDEYQQTIRQAYDFLNSLEMVPVALTEKFVELKRTLESKVA